MDVFTWSVPFVAEKVVEMLINVLKQGTDLKSLEDNSDADPNALPDPSKIVLSDGDEGKGKKADLLRNKVRAMSRMMKMYKTLREENESIVMLKGICPDGRVPKGLLLEGKKALETELLDRKDFFSKAKKLDIGNEAMPGEGGSSTTDSHGS